MVKKRNKRVVLRRKKNNILLFAVLLILIAVLILVLFFRGGISGNATFYSGQEYCRCEMQVYDGGTEPGSLSNSQTLDLQLKADCNEAYSTRDKWGKLEAWVPVQTDLDFPKVKIYNCRRAANF